MHKVHKSLLKKDLIMGVKKPVLILMIFMGTLGWFVAGKWGLIVIPVIYLPCFILTKGDDDFLDIFLESLTLPDHLEG